MKCTNTPTLTLTLAPTLAPTRKSLPRKARGKSACSAPSPSPCEGVVTPPLSRPAWVWLAGDCPPHPARVDECKPRGFDRPFGGLPLRYRAACRALFRLSAARHCNGGPPVDFAVHHGGTSITTQAGAAGEPFDFRPPIRPYRPE